MPQYNEPVSLEKLCYRTVKSHLITLCQTLHDKNIAPGQLRKCWITSLPGTIRTNLLMESSDINHSSIPFYLSSLLLAPDVHKLKIEICCYYGCTHQAAIMRLLADEGKGLRSLELARSSLLRFDQTLLKTVLLNTIHLQHLIIRNIATDASLAVIGSTCEKLVLLDISNSRQVSDNGVKDLLIKYELRHKNDLHNLNIDELSTDSVASRQRQSRLRNVYKMLRGMQSVLGSCKGEVPGNRSDSYSDLLLEFYEIPTVLSTTLKVLNITNTGVTVSGVFLALENSKHLQSVGEFPKVGHVMELFESKYQSPPTFQLKTARMSETSAYSFNLVNKLCPDIEQLVVIDTKFLPSELSPIVFHDRLKSLILLGIPPSLVWLLEFYELLNAIPNVEIQELVLKFFTLDGLMHIELGDLLSRCPKLRILVIDGAEINWTTPLTNQKETMIEKIHLGQKVSSKVLVNISKCSPCLTTLHFYYCPDIHDEELLCFTSKTLKCFYIYEMRLMNATAVINELLNNCPNLQNIGYNKIWEDTVSLIDSVKHNNYNVQFNAGSHWYHSTCMNKYE